MIVVISPAKTLDFETPATTPEFTTANLLEQSQLLINRCQQLSMQDIASLMKVSDKIAGLNVARFAEWKKPLQLENNTKQCLFAFKGDVYTGLEAETLSDHTLQYAQQNLRILSGLYGLLRPLDLMLAYRLEMGTRLDNERGTNLYQFWGDLITEQLNLNLTAQDSPYLVNLASNEYFKAVKTKALKATVITPIFKDQKNGQYKVISFYAKKARGLMARYIMENEITDIKQLKEFTVGGYYFVAAASTETDLVFQRDEQ
ncbi:MULTISPECIES: peroxide stress protein YaaA [Psychromonas]|uniref:peroxide stress protein YaaA n=1 Tax=Psychromonas TaxID=67572 RepID=UPI000406398E|nr:MULTISPECIES: peroxide stress protein YaaA [Psychromonas]MBB1274772.1 peroxide stress protein YaaA [Psychromonas sp. SR45-3]